MWQLDRDRSGTIDNSEFSKALSTIGAELTTEEFAHLFRELDPDNSGKHFILVGCGQGAAWLGCGCILLEVGMLA